MRERRLSIDTERTPGAGRNVLAADGIGNYIRSKIAAMP